MVYFILTLPFINVHINGHIYVQINVDRNVHLVHKNDRNGGIWQSGISKSLAEYFQRHVRFVNVQSSLHENVIFSVCAHIWTMPRILYLSCGIPFPV